MVAHLISLKDSGACVDKPLAEKIETHVTSKLFSPLMYNKAFPAFRSSGEEGASDEDAEDAANKPAEGEREDEPNFIENLGTEGCPRGVILIAELFKKTYDGTYSEAIAALANHAKPLELLVAAEEPPSVERRGS